MIGSLIFCWLIIELRIFFLFWWLLLLLLFLFFIFNFWLIMFDPRYNWLWPNSFGLIVIDSSISCCNIWIFSSSGDGRCSMAGTDSLLGTMFWLWRTTWGITTQGTARGDASRRISAALEESRREICSTSAVTGRSWSMSFGWELLFWILKLSM